MSRIGSLCSGYGGLEIGLQLVVGGDIAWHAEYDDAPSKILAQHWPDVPNHGDITQVNWSRVEPVDWVTAGFPCQDISTAGKGAGITEGTRSGLWFYIADAISVLRPRHLFLENVSRIVTRRPGLDVVLADLARLGFDAEWVCVRASDVGAPHRRERWFCLATNTGRVRGQRRGNPRNLARSPGTGHGERDQRQWNGHTLDDRSATPANSTSDGRDEGRTEPAGIKRGLDAALSGSVASDTDGWGFEGGQELDREAAHDPANWSAWWRHSDGQLCTDWGSYGPAIRRWEHILGRPGPAPTEPGRNAEPRLSPAFVEWLMGLPEGWVTGVPGISRNSQLKALGNGVIPQQAAYALSLLLNAAGVAA